MYLRKSLREALSKIPLNLQAKLLRVFETRKFRRIGLCDELELSKRQVYRILKKYNIKIGKKFKQNLVNRHPGMTNK